jgi:hypothetical protein
MRLQATVEEFRFGFAEIQPRRPVIQLKDDHLAIMYRRDVGSCAVVRRVKASPVPFGIQRPAK